MVEKLDLHLAVSERKLWCKMKHENVVQQKILGGKFPKKMLIYPPFFPFRSTGLSQLSYRYDLISRVSSTFESRKACGGLGFTFGLHRCLGAFHRYQTRRWVGLRYGSAGTGAFWRAR